MEFVNGGARRLVRQLRARGISDERVLAAFARVPRDFFVPQALAPDAWEDNALPIGEGQTISQPTMIAMTLEALALDGHEQVLDIGTGSGYQAALLGILAKEVVGVEFLAVHASAARKRIEALGMKNVAVLRGDGGFGWPDRAPYDVIVAAATAPRVPPPLIEQLRPGGRIAVPIGLHDGPHTMMVYTRSAGTDLVQRAAIPCHFVPMRGIHGQPDERSA